jgi:hypothetical protein
MGARELLPADLLCCTNRVISPGNSKDFCGGPSATFWLLEWESATPGSPIYNIVGRCASHPVNVLGDLWNPDGRPLRAVELTVDEVLVREVMSK